MASARPLIFISYRREDSGGIVGHLYDRLVARYGQETVFRDVDDIPRAKDFREVIGDALTACDVVLVMIGPAWARSHTGRDRIREDDDPVRLEVERALSCGAAVIPVMVEGAGIPSAHELPESLALLPSLNGAILHAGKDFEFQVADLIASVDKILDERGKFIIRFPRWAGAAAISLLVAATAVLALLVGSTPLGVALPSLVAPLGAAAISIALTAAVGLALGMIAAHRALPFRLGGDHPIATAVVSAVAAMPVLFLGCQSAIARLPIRDEAHLADHLHTDYLVDVARAETSGARPDFSREKQIIAELLSIDPNSGYALYYSGEVKRVSNPALFTIKSCLKAWPGGHAGALDAYEEDFYRYLDIEQNLPAQVVGYDPGLSACYGSPQGYCEQRTAWVSHLLANDFFLEAQALAGPARIEALNRAKNLAGEAMKYASNVGRGFSQCTSSSSLQAQIEAELRATAQTSPGGGAAAL